MKCLIETPWSLTKREFELLDGMARTGSMKAAYIEMGIALQTASELMRRAKNRMGARTPLQAVLTFDRWKRSAA